MGFDVLIPALRASADSVAAVAAGVRNADLAGCAGEVADALPGSTSQSSAQQLGLAWRDRVTGWAVSADRYAQSLRDAANTYQTEDAASRDRLIRAARGLAPL